MSGVKSTLGLYARLKAVRAELDAILSDVSYRATYECEDAGGHHWEVDGSDQHNERCSVCRCVRARQGRYET